MQTNRRKKITKKLITKLEVLIEEKCEAFFIKNHIPNIDEPRIADEILTLKNSSTAIENDIKLLHIKSDSTLCSLTYILDEYDDVLVQRGKFIRDNQSLTSTISSLHENLDKINKMLTQTQKKLE